MTHGFAGFLYCRSLERPSSLENRAIHTVKPPVESWFGWLSYVPTLTIAPPVPTLVQISVAYVHSTRSFLDPSACACRKHAANCHLTTR